jgi:hypothetical protein
VEVFDEDGKKDDSIGQVKFLIPTDIRDFQRRNLILKSKNE